MGPRRWAGHPQILLVSLSPPAASKSPRRPWPHSPPCPPLAPSAGWQTLTCLLCVLAPARLPVPVASPGSRGCGRALCVFGTAVPVAGRGAVGTLGLPCPRSFLLVSLCFHPGRLTSLMGNVDSPASACEYFSVSFCDGRACGGPWGRRSCLNGAGSISRFMGSGVRLVDSSPAAGPDGGCPLFSLSFQVSPHIEILGAGTWALCLASSRRCPSSATRRWRGRKETPALLRSPPRRPFPWWPPALWREPFLGALLSLLAVLRSLPTPRAAAPQRLALWQGTGPPSYLMTVKGVC